MISLVLTPSGSSYQLWELGTWRPVVVARLALPTLRSRPRIQAVDGSIVTIDHLYLCTENGLLFEAFLEPDEYRRRKQN